MYGDIIPKEEIQTKEEPIVNIINPTDDFLNKSKKGKLGKSNTFSKKLKWVVICNDKNLLGSSFGELPIESSYNIVGSYIGEKVSFITVLENGKWCARIIKETPKYRKVN